MTYTLHLSESMPPKIDDKTLALLNRLLGESNPIIHPVKPQGDFREEIVRLDLPAAPGAEYFFRLWFYEGGERQISAQLIQDRCDDTYFWYRPLEMAEFGGSEDDLVSEFCEELEALLTHETRIVQQKGWLFWDFRCEYRAGEMWKSIYSPSAFRGGRFRPPKIKGRKRVYRSAPIATAGRQFED
jgi:hypothetical protein